MNKYKRKLLTAYLQHSSIFSVIVNIKQHRLAGTPKTITVCHNSGLIQRYWGWLCLHGGITCHRCCLNNSCCFISRSAHDTKTVVDIVSILSELWNTVIFYQLYQIGSSRDFKFCWGYFHMIKYYRISQPHHEHRQVAGIQVQCEEHKCI